MIRTYNDFLKIDKDVSNAIYDNLQDIREVLIEMNLDIKGTIELTNKIALVDKNDFDMVYSLIPELTSFIDNKLNGTQANKELVERFVELHKKLETILTSYSNYMEVSLEAKAIEEKAEAEKMKADDRVDLSGTILEPLDGLFDGLKGFI